MYAATRIKMRDDLSFYISFISEIEQNPAIYDHSLPDYSNRRVTEMIWAKIGKKFNETGIYDIIIFCKIRTAEVKLINYTNNIRQ